MFLIDSDSTHALMVEQCFKQQAISLVVCSSLSDVVKQLDSATGAILIANPFSNKNLFKQLLTVKEKYPDLELILYAAKEQLKKVMDTFSTNLFSIHETPVNTDILSLSVAQARNKILLKKENEQYSHELLEVNTGKALLDQLFDEVPCYISVQDKDLKITKVNKRFKTQFGENIGEYCYDIYKNRTSPCEECPVAQTFIDGKSHRTEETVTSKTGKQYNVLTQTAPITDEKGQISRVMELSVNITQIRQLQDHLASLGLMLGSMFHGVKGTLTALDGGLYQLENGIEQKDHDKVVAAHNQIKTMVDKIKKMVVEILDYAKSRELQYEKVEVSQFIQSVIETCRPVADKAGVGLKIEATNTPETIEVDSGWLEAALINFLENSVEACVADGAKKTHVVSFKVTQSNSGQICFNISDNGVGMDQEAKDKLFTLFFTSKGPKGTGLGMFIANRVIRYHGGRVEFQSELGKGTSFKVYLPCEKTGSYTEKTLSKIDIRPDVLDVVE